MFILTHKCNENFKIIIKKITQQKIINLATGEFTKRVREMSSQLLVIYPSEHKQMRRQGKKKEKKSKERKKKKKTQVPRYFVRKSAWVLQGFIS